MRTKRYKTIKEKSPTEAVPTSEAVDFIKQNTRSKFDETIELHIGLGINPAKSDQMVRGSVTLPAGSVKKQRIIVFTNDSAVSRAALDAGAERAGGDDLLKEIKDTGSLDADITIATPDMMPKIAGVARILGPKGLMPNPKIGTVTPDPAKAVKDLQSGKTSFKMDQLGNIHLAVGKVSWEAEKIIANINAVMDVMRHSRPASAKGEFIQSLTISSTMGPGISINSK